MAASIAFIGLGNMGGPMAANLVKAGHDVIGFDLSRQSCGAAEGKGVSIASTPVDAAKDADVVVTMLPAGQHVLAVWNEISSALKPGTLLIDCSTIDVESARKAHILSKEVSCLSLDAPVSGGTVGAAAGAETQAMSAERHSSLR